MLPPSLVPEPPKGFPFTHYSQALLGSSILPRSLLLLSPHLPMVPTCPPTSVVDITEG